MGLATSVSPGATNIIATSGSTSGSTTLKVTAATLVSITVTPAKYSIAKGTTQHFTATGIFNDKTKQDLTKSVTWSSSDTKVATISNALGSAGRATAGGLGTTTISCTSGSISGSASLTVTAATLVSIMVIPAKGLVARGLTVQFSATGMYTDNSKQNLTKSVTWSSSNTLAVSISNSGGSHGLAMAKDLGTATVTATSGSITGSTTLSVTAAKLESIVVTPTKPSIARGTTQQFTAIGIYSDSTTQNLTKSATWFSSNTKVATISNAVGSTGLATGEGLGSTTITAYWGTISGKATLTVTAAKLVSLAVTPPNPSVAKGLTKPFAATGGYTDKSTKDLTKSVFWSSSDTKVATISSAKGAAGLAITVGVGKTTITATSGSLGSCNRSGG